MSKTMERNERYDPEDLEHLLLERGFDELLAEERAYVLRHVEGRDEYGRMRGFLLRMRTEPDDGSPLDADPAVRERVLEVFREQRRPHWTIWLNSVQAFLLPKRPAEFWRPALAFATMAVIAIGSVLLWRSAGQPQHPALAEVKPKVQPEPVQIIQPKKRVPPQQVPTENAKDGAGSSQAKAAATARMPSLDERRVEPNTRNEERKGMAEFETNLVKAERREKVTAGSVVTSADSIPRSFAAVAGAPPPMPMAPASAMDQAATRNSVTKEAESEPATYTEDDLLGLLRAAW